MKIALLGTRGVPANYGGFETFYEELGKRLAERGHDITVYCRESYYPEKYDSYLGMKLVYCQNFKIKSLDTLSHTFFSVLHAIRQPYEVYMVCNAANSPILIIPRLLGRKIVINTDGLEWKRGKWGAVAKAYYQCAEWLATKLSDRIVADSTGIQDYYLQRYGVESTYIAYGAYPNKSVKPELLGCLDLNPSEYFLQITRFEPENNPLLTIEAFKQLKTNKKLVLVGGVPYESEYSRQIEMQKSDQILLPGPIYDKELLNELWCNCYAYIHGNEVGGTNPALLQAMANGCFTIAIDVSFSRDVLKDCGIFFDKTASGLSDKMQWSLSHTAKLHDYKSKARNRIKKHYTWDSITDDYDALFNGLVAS